MTDSLRRRVAKLEQATGADGDCCSCPGVGPRIIIREAGQADRGDGPTACERCGRSLDVLIIEIVRTKEGPAWQTDGATCGDA